MEGSASTKTGLLSTHESCSIIQAACSTKNRHPTQPSKLPPNIQQTLQYTPSTLHTHTHTLLLQPERGMFSPWEMDAQCHRSELALRLTSPPGKIDEANMKEQTCPRVCRLKLLLLHTELSELQETDSTQRPPIKQESESCFSPTLTIYSKLFTKPSRLRWQQKWTHFHDVLSTVWHRINISTFPFPFSTYDSLSCNHGNSRGNQCQHQQQTRRYFFYRLFTTIISKRETRLFCALSLFSFVYASPFSDFSPLFCLYTTACYSALTLSVVHVTKKSKWPWSCTPAF